MEGITGPLVCSECGVEFLQHEGGQCTQCQRLFCGVDLFVREDEPTSPVCRACRPSDAKTRPLLPAYKAASLSMRRRMKKGLG